MNKEPDLTVVIDPKDYRIMAGPDWPTLAELCAGQRSNDSYINTELTAFIADQQAKYQAKTRSGAQLALENKQRQGQTFYNKEYTGTQQCRIPWNTLGINSNGDCYICQSPSWIPLFVGNILETDDIFTVLNSDTARSIRQEILDRTYLYCNSRICGFFSHVDPTAYKNSSLMGDPRFLLQNTLTLVKEIPSELIFDFDYTCNLTCKSCRTTVINWNTDHVRRPVNDLIVKQIKHLIVDQIKDQPITVRWCGGEPFISDVYSELLTYISNANKKNIEHVIQTNGHYLQKNSLLLTDLLPTVKELRISFDAASRATYHRVRSGGSWDLLLANVGWARAYIDQLGVGTQLIADFVVQRENYREIPEFVALCKQLGIDRFNLQKMWNWGTADQVAFDSNNVYNKQHPEYPELCRILHSLNLPVLE